MAFKIFAGGATLSAADLNDYLMEQSVIVCTSGTRPASPAEGWTIYETDTDLYKMYSGSTWVTAVQPGAWTSYTPRVHQKSGGPWTNNLSGLTITRAKYRRVGRSVQVSLVISVGGSGGDASQQVYVELPVTAVTTGMIVGAGYIYDSSANLTYKGLAYASATDALSLIGTTSTSPSALGIADFTAGLANGDAIAINAEYEAAS